MLTYRFVKGSRPGRGSGFDVDEDDLLELDKYHDVIVASAIFGTFDILSAVCECWFHSLILFEM